MFQRFHQMKEERERGFTLIELLVVILIIAILAAIAIPVFLRQREKGWRSQLESALANARTAQESYLTVNDAYTDDIDALKDEEGLKTSESVTLTATFDEGITFCVEGTHSDLGDDVTLAVSSEISEPTEGTCNDDGTMEPDA